MHTISFKGNAGQWLLTRNHLNCETQNCRFCYSCHHSFQKLFVSACFWMSVHRLFCRIKHTHFQDKGCLSNISGEYSASQFLNTQFCFWERWYYLNVFQLVKLYSMCNTDRGIKLRIKEVELLLFSYGTVLNWSACGNNPSWFKICHNRAAFYGFYCITYLTVGDATALNFNIWLSKIVF